MDTMDTSQDTECGLILEALQMHLETIRTRLVSLTEHFQSQVEIPTLETSPPQLPTPSVSPVTNTSVSNRETESHVSPPSSHLLRRGRAGRSSSVSTLTDTSSSSTHPKCKPLSAQLSDWKPLHNYYKHVHLEVLQEHVQLQLHRQREMDNKWKLKCRDREARERRARLALKPRTLRSELKNDTLFLQKLHTSIFYKIVEAEYKMRKKGLLRSRVDHELFWDTMLSQDRTKRSPPLPVSSTIVEEPEDLTNTWAITGMQETSIPADSSHVRVKSTDEILADLKQAMEANKPPKMHSLSELIKSAPALLSESSEVSKAALVEVRAARDKMHKMTEHSKRNEYTAQQFMGKSDFVDFSSVFSEFCSQLDTQLDNIPLKCPPKQLPRVTPSKKRVSLPPISHPPQQLERFVKPSVPVKNPSVSELIPLSMSEVVSCGSVVVRTTKTSLWRNTMVSID